MADPMATCEEVLAARHARARAAMATYLRRFAGAPADPLRVFHPLGGFVLEQEVAASRLPGLWEALAESGIGRSSHSFGGGYLAADPSLYVTPPPWSERRRRIDRRVRHLLAALPDRVERSELDFASWLSLMVALDVLRTDLCSILWNELAFAEAAGAPDLGAVARCEAALGACVGATLDLLPPLDADPAAADGRADVVLLAGRMRPPPVLASAPPTLAEDAVRALRASDNTFLVWASLALLAAEREARTDPCWAIGNGFGGIDLGYFAAAALATVGVDALAGTCRAGGHGAPRAEPDRARWPSGRPPRTVLFCDDSVSSGGTFRAFRRFCRRTVSGAAVEAFLLTYDLGARREDDDAERERFALARHATAAAPWSPSPHPKLGPPRHLRDLLAALRASSDERLRWLAESETATLAALNEATR